MGQMLTLLIEGKRAGETSLESALQKGKLTVQKFVTTREALNFARSYRPDIVIFDAASLGSSGVQSCRKLRSALPYTPLIHCRAASAPENRAAGADVYLVQPFTTRKLLNRIKALLPADQLEEEIVRTGELTYFVSKRSVNVGSRGERRLTPKLATLLEEFLQHPGEVLGRRHLMQKVWDTNYFGDTRTLDVHVRWVREMIEENPAVPKLLRTVRGVGYVFSVAHP